MSDSLPSPSLPPTLDLDDPRAMDAHRTGRKAARLAQLRQEGFPVPEGLVLTVGALRELKRNEKATLSPSLRSALSSVGDRWPDTPLAVRSSAADEDRPDASFAGQYETVLGVRAGEELEAAVRRCAAAVSSARVERYRSRGGAGRKEPEGAGLALLVQPLVDADAAGVAFTADPVTGDRDRVLVHGVRGLGDRLVSGEAVPDEWIVTEDRTEARSRLEKAVDSEAAREVARLARRVESLLRAPQDVEWALADGEVHLLQARPITALPSPPEIRVPEGRTWMKDEAHFPEPITPLGATTYLPALEAALPSVFEHFGLLMDRVEQRAIGWEVYLRAVPVGGKEGPPPPPWLFRILIRLLPSLRRRVKRAREVVRSGELDRALARWEEEWRPELEEKAAELRSVELGTLTDRELDAHLERTLELQRRGQLIHFLLFIPYAVRVYQLARTCRELLDWDSSRTMELLQGLSDASSEGSRALEPLARRILDTPGARDALGGGGPEALDRLGALDPELDSMIADYLERFGHRVLGYDPGLPTLAEEPGLFARVLRDAVRRVEGRAPELEEDASSSPSAARNGPGGRASAREERRRLAAAREQAGRRALEALSDPGARDRFEDALERCREAYPIREDNVYLTDSIPGGLVRGAALEMGRRLAERGRVDEVKDVVWLEAEELRRALPGPVHRGGKGSPDGEGSPEGERAPQARPEEDLRARIRRRRAEHHWVRAHPGPSIRGEPPAPPPDLEALPSEAGLLMGAMGWFMEEEFPMDAAGDDGEPRAGPDGGAGTPANAGARGKDGEIPGRAGSPGRYRGPARIVLHQGDFHRVQPGDVLVSPVTTPTWSVLFGTVGAVVTDGGSPLSHTAIVAREHGIPAVVATGEGTRAIRDGEVVQVDGTAGVVRRDASVTGPAEGESGGWGSKDETASQAQARPGAGERA